MTTITSLQNPRVKEAVRLRDRSHRDKQGRFPIDGARELGRAISSGVELLEIFICRPLCESDDARRVLDALQGSAGASRPTVQQWDVSRPVFEKLAFGDRAEGLLGVAATPSKTLADFPLTDNPLVGVIEGLEKPGNIGAVMRSADGAGLDGLIVADGRTDLFNPNTIRASLGTIFTLPVASASAAETLVWLRDHGLAVHAARVDGSVPYTEVDYRGPSAIVLGSEARGLGDAWRADFVTPVRLPMLGAADSLNVSATAAVLFYEARRQRS